MFLENKINKGYIKLKDFLVYLTNLKKDEPGSFNSIDFYKNDFHLTKLQNFLEKDKKISIFELARFIDSTNIFDIHNRKYLGSKYNLLDFIESTIINVVGQEIESFFDCFSGTGVVAQRFGKYAKKVIANDFLYSNYLSNKVFLSSKRKEIKIERIYLLINMLNQLTPIHDYTYNNFSKTYFTEYNAGKIDAVREEIEKLYTKKECTKSEKEILLVSLLYAIDKVANTLGQYDAFLKNIGSNVMVGGKHKIDENVYKELYLRRPIIYFERNNEVFNDDSNELAAKISAEVVYLDPPYNIRQYINCYHVLENIMLWQKPQTFGKTKKFKREHLKSNFSTKRKATQAFDDLVSKLKCKYIFLSYNTEGIIKDEDIFQILRKKGSLNVFKKPYSIFGKGAGVSQKRPIKERIFYVRVGG